ncbi:hypothetical protein D3C87_2006590 [compost metagenome]
MHEPSAVVQRQTAADQVDRRELRLCVPGRDIDDQPRDLAAHHPVQRVLDHSVMRGNDHLVAHSLLEEIPGKVQPIFLAL